LIWKSAALAHLDSSGDIYVFTDASRTGVGVMLTQRGMDGSVKGITLPSAKIPTDIAAIPMRAIIFLSHKFSEAASNWSTIEQECFAVFFAIIKLQSYLLGRHFFICTDHRNLMYLEKSVVPKLVRWRLRLLEFNYSVIHIPGSSNVVADQLSRLNLLSSSLDIIQRVQVYRLVIIEGTQVSTSDIISNFHNEVVGHHGVSQTCILIKRAKRHWPGFHTDIRQFIKACVICQKVKHQPVPELSLQKYHLHGSYPMRDLSVDSIGPLPADDLGNRHILVIIDNFTKFVSLFPTLSTTALSYAQALLSHTGIYGIMSTIRSDGGTQFTADICTQLAKLFNFEHHIILPYHPQANGIVERKNAEIMKHLRAIILTTKDKHHWSLYLPIVQRILNSTIDTTSGVSPSELIFGNQLPIMSPLLVQSVNATSTDSEHDYIKQITMYTSVLVDRSLKFLQKANVETQAIDMTIMYYW
jgi:hypothetical protein